MYFPLAAASFLAASKSSIQPFGTLDDILAADAVDAIATAKTKAQPNSQIGRAHV